MITRLIIGLLKGFSVGALVAAGLIEGLHLTAMPAVLLYVCAALVGALTGLVAGKPIWMRGAMIEVGLKAFFGALLGAGAMFAWRRWVGPAVDPILASQVPMLAAAPYALAPVAAVLGALFEVDNTPEPAAAEGDGKRAKAGAATKGAEKKGKVRVAADQDDEEEEVEEAPAKKKR
jgi:hypothetical protein